MDLSHPFTRNGPNHRSFSGTLTAALLLILLLLALEYPLVVLVTLGVTIGLCKTLG